MKIQIILEPSSEEGFTAFTPVHPCCLSQVDTGKWTIDLYLEPIKNNKS